MPRLSSRRVLPLFLLTAAACTSADTAARATDATAEPTLATATAVGLRNAKMPIAGMVTGGQPDQAQLDALVAAGFENFISLRPAGEDGAGWEESGVGAPASFARLPIRGGTDLTRENVEALGRMLDEAGDGATVLYCASGNRVGALLALKAAWLDGVPPEDAMELGLAAGMTRLEPAVAELLGLEG